MVGEIDDGILRRVRFKCMDLNIVVKGTNRLYTRKLGESIVERFKYGDLSKHELWCVDNTSSTELNNGLNNYVSYPDIVGVISDITISDAIYNEECLIAEVKILDTPKGRILNEKIQTESYRLYPIGYADTVEVDGIEIMTGDSYDLVGFTIGQVIKR